MPCFRDYVFKAMLGEWIDVWMKNQFAFFSYSFLKVKQVTEEFVSNLCSGIKDRDIWNSKE